MSRAITSDDIDRLERQVRQLAALHTASTAAVGHEQRLTALEAEVVVLKKVNESLFTAIDKYSQAAQCAEQKLAARLVELEQKVADLEPVALSELFEPVESVVLPGNEMVQLVGGTGDGSASS